MEEKEIFEKLRSFIGREVFVKDEEIAPDTIIETELGVTGDDADEFIIAFGKEFNVDISEFNIGKYFRGEGDTTLISLFNFLRGKKTKEKKLVLTVNDLVRAVIVGKLDDSLIRNKDN